MKLLSFLSALLLSFPNMSVAHQPTGSTSISSSQATPQRDPSAIAFLTQAVSMAGGSSAIRAVQDFTAQGSITHYWNDNPEQGQATVKARGLSQFRVDSTLQEGTWSVVINNGNGELFLTDGSTKSIAYHNTLNTGSMTWPIAKINAALMDPTTTIVDLGVVQFGSSQARKIGIQQYVQPDDSFSKLTRREYFFDSSSYLLLRVQDIVHPEDDMVNGSVQRVLDFGNYQVSNGLLVPFAIRQSIAGQQIWAIQLNSIVFNSGLADSDFQL